MHLRNKRYLFAAATVLLLGSWLIAQDSTAPAPTQPSAGTQQATPQQTQPAQQQAPRPQVRIRKSRKRLLRRPRLISPATQSKCPNKDSRRLRQNNDVFVFKKEVDEVTLHATVVDDHFRPITDLNKTDFTVFEDGKPQKITSFRNEDIPVALGIVIDNSGSMRDKRPQVNAAALNLVRSSNPQDQVFVVNFNEEYFLDQDYTGSVPKLKDALERIESRGGTALV